MVQTRRQAAQSKAPPSPRGSCGSDLNERRGNKHPPHHGKAKRRAKTVAFHDAHNFLQDNHYIKHGYRHEHTIKDCLVSLFTLHNETLNVWTHLFALGYFIWLTYRCVNEPFVDHYAHRIAFLAGTLPGCLCFMFSSLFHLFGCINERVYDILLRFDFSGIGILIGGSFITGTYFGFLCHPPAQQLYVSIFSVIGSIVAMSTFIPSFTNLRIYVFVGMIALSVFPLSHWVAVSHLEHGEYYFFFGVLCMLLLYATGFAAYLTRFPERISPGSFDIWGHSHQIWHVFTFLAANLLIEALLMYYKWRVQRPCSVSYPTHFGDLEDYVNASAVI
eukprot:Colp12_sorted_trinity150504_noHs@18609